MGVGVGGLPVRSCLARQKLASVSPALSERGTQTFRTSSHHPRLGRSLPTRAPESGIVNVGPALPPLGSGAREPEISPWLSLALSPRASGSPRSRVPEVLCPKDKLNFA